MPRMLTPGKGEFVLVCIYESYTSSAPNTALTQLSTWTGNLSTLPLYSLRVCVCVCVHK